MMKQLGFTLFNLLPLLDVLQKQKCYNVVLHNTTHVPVKGVTNFPVKQ